MKDETAVPKAHRPVFVKNSGRIWFSAEAERRFYFFLTLAMLGAGILYKMGVL